MATGSNICECRHPPPGSQVVCEPDEVAICDSVGERQVHACVKLPPTVKTRKAAAAWTLSHILEREITEAEIQRSEQLQQILADGFYRDPRSERTVCFRVPAIEQVESELMHSLDVLISAIGKYALGPALLIFLVATLLHAAVRGSYPSQFALEGILLICAVAGGLAYAARKAATTPPAR